MLKIKSWSAGAWLAAGLLAGLMSVESVAQPQVAIDACQGKKENESCSFEGRRGTAKGTCQNHNGKWVCALNKPGRPSKGHPPREKPGKHSKRQPPAVVIDACQNKREGESCSFEGRRGTVNGTCRTHNQQTVCQPEHRR